MKKNLAIATAAVGAAIALVFASLLLCAAFGGLTADDFNGGAARILITALAGIFLALTAVTIGLLSGKGIRSEVRVASCAGGSIRISPQVIRKLIKKSVSGEKGVDWRGCTLFIDENGVRAEISVSCRGGTKTSDAGARIQSLALAGVERELGLKLCAADIRVVGFRGGCAPGKTRAAGETAANIGDGEPDDTPDVTESDALRNILRHLSSESAQTDDSSSDTANAVGFLRHPSSESVQTDDSNETTSPEEYFRENG